jgi:hypothetical protein
MHGVPSTVDVSLLVGDLRNLAGTVFVTGLANDYYASFSTGWAQFANAMAG